MTDFIRTECPNCHAQYKIGLNQLSTGKSKAKCGRCGTSFAIKDNLRSQSFLTSDDKNAIANSTKEKERASKRPASTNKKVEYIQDFSINDEKVTPASSLFDTASNQSKKESTEPSKHTAITSADKRSQTPSNVSMSSDAVKEEDEKSVFGQEWEATQEATSKTSNRSKTDPKNTSKVAPAKTSVTDIPPTKDNVEDELLFHDNMDVAKIEGAVPETDDTLDEDDWLFDENLINAQISNTPIKKQSTVTEDDSWLEDLLASEEQTQNNHSTTEHQAITPTSDSDLANLLDDLGVESSEPAVPPQDTARAMIDKRLKSKPKQTLNKSSILTSILWLIGCVVLSFVLLAQYAVFNLENLIKDPAHRATLQSFCDVVTCALPSADISSITIGERQYKSSKVTQEGTDIIATITNQSDSEQLYPNLRVELYNAEGIVGDFIATPSEYLMTSHSIISPLQTTQIMLTIEINTSNINDVKIIPFY